MSVLSKVAGKISKVVQNSGIHEKMTIKAWDCTSKSGDDPRDTFIVQFNPTKYNETWKNNYKTTKIIGGQEKVEWVNAPPDKVSFEFLLDSTLFDPLFLLQNTDLFIDPNPEKNGTIDLIKTSSVYKAIEKFKQITTEVIGASHIPSFLKLNWGEFEFKGYLTDMNINHELFDTTGTPIRSRLSCNFVREILPEDAENSAKSNSPDLTHFYTVKTGDTLPLISREIYGNPGLYLEIARVNNLTNFRKLNAGQRLLLPPISKS